MDKIKDALHDVYRYLEQLQGSKLDGALEAERQRLFNHIKKLLNIESPQTTLDEYLPMNGSSQEINDTDLIEESFYEAPEGSSDDDSHKTNDFEITTPEPIKNVFNKSLPEKDLEDSPFKNWSYQKAQQKNIKAGPLECKKNRKNRTIRNVLKSLCTMSAVIIDNWLLLYNNEYDEEPTFNINLVGYKAQECLNPTTKDAKKKDCCFEITHDGKESHQFYAISNKEMEKWIMHINSVHDKQNAYTRKLPTPPSIPKMEHKLFTFDKDDVTHEVEEEEEAKYESEDIYECVNTITNFNTPPLNCDFQGKSLSDHDISIDSKFPHTSSPNRRGSDEDTKSIVSLPIGKPEISPKNISLSPKISPKASVSSIDSSLPALPPRIPNTPKPFALQKPRGSEEEDNKPVLTKPIIPFHTFPKSKASIDRIPKPPQAPSQVPTPLEVPSPPKPVKFKPEIPEKPKMNKKPGLPGMASTSGNLPPWVRATSAHNRSVIEELLSRQKLEKKQAD